MTFTAEGASDCPDSHGMHDRWLTRYDSGDVLRPRMAAHTLAERLIEQAPPPAAPRGLGPERPDGLSERALQLCDDVLRVLAHDLRNPLSIVMMGAGVLAARGAEPGDPKCDSIVLAAERMEQLIRNVLDLAALTLGRRTLQRGPHAIEVLLQDVHQQPVFRALERPALVLELPEAPCRLHVDASLVVQALAGLAFAAAALGPGDLDWRVSQADGWVRLAVRARSMRWEPGFVDLIEQSIRGRDLQVPGTGLSLSLARVVVEAHGGTVSVEPVSETAGGLVATLPAAPETG